jgi:flagellar biosynthesis protein FliQ
VSQAFLSTVFNEAIATTLKLALPTLLVSMGVGLLVSIIQAVTQIQEQTLTFIPKAFAVGLTLVLMGPWMLNSLIQFTNELYAKIPLMTGN